MSQNPEGDGGSHLEITVYSMKNMADGEAMIAEIDEHIDFYDIVIQSTDSDDPIQEIEDIPTREEAQSALDELRVKYPLASVEWVW